MSNLNSPSGASNKSWILGGDRRRARQEEAANWDAQDEILHRIENEPLPASSGSGVDGHLLMRWDEWAKALWTRYGSTILRREEQVLTWAQDSGYDSFQPTAVNILDHVPNRHALFADVAPKPTFPYPRNQITIPMSKSGRLDVLVADYNRFSYHLHNKQPRVSMQPTSIALSPFPRSSSLIITPRVADTPVPMWEAVAGPIIETGSRKFDSNFTTYARDPRWARETLTSELKRWLYQAQDVRIMADRDSLLCIYLPAWIPTSEIDELADLAFSLSKSAREASHLLK